MIFKQNIFIGNFCYIQYMQYINFERLAATPSPSASCSVHVVYGCLLSLCTLALLNGTYVGLPYIDFLALVLR